jgi:hypothetical protein
MAQAATRFKPPLYLKLRRAHAWLAWSDGQAWLERLMFLPRRKCVHTNQSSPESWPQHFLKESAKSRITLRFFPFLRWTSKIRRAAYRAIYSFPSLERYSTMALALIHIVVKGGQLTLEGVVANEADRTAADIRAKTVPSVFSVTDNPQSKTV